MNIRTLRRAGPRWGFLLCVLLTPGAGKAGSPAKTAEPTTLRLLSYNIRNLPDSRFDERRPRILDVLEAYDAALLQEDFGPGGIHEEWPGPVFRAPEAAARWYYLFAPLIRLSQYRVPYGAGLTILIAEDMAERWRAEKLLRIAYGDCHGILRYSHDCWANKGLLGIRLTAPAGGSVDLYTTHLDAGAREGDRAVRREQLDVIREQIAEHSDGRAVVLAGDFNTRPRHSEDLDALMESVDALELEDSGARPTHENGQNCRVDYVFVRDGDDTEIEVIDAREPPSTYRGAVPGDVNFCAEEWRERALSDHPAMAVTLELRRVESNVD